MFLIFSDLETFSLQSHTGIWFAATIYLVINCHCCRGDFVLTAIKIFQCHLIPSISKMIHILPEILSPQRNFRVWLLRGSCARLLLLEVAYDVYAKHGTATARRVMVSDTMPKRLKTIFVNSHPKIYLLDRSKVLIVNFNAVHYGCRRYSWWENVVHCHYCWIQNVTLTH